MGRVGWQPNELPGSSKRLNAGVGRCAARWLVAASLATGTWAGSSVALAQEAERPDIQLEGAELEPIGHPAR